MAAGSSGRATVLLAAAVLVTGAVLVTACTGSTPTSAPADISASAYRSRDDDARGGRSQITVTNTGDRRVAIHTVALDSAGFAAADPSVREIDLPKGNRIDIPTFYGAADCSAEVEPLNARLSVTRDGEPMQNIVVPLEQPYDIIDRIHDEECTAERVRDDVTLTLSLSAPPSVATDPVNGMLTVTREASTEPIRVDELRGSLLYALHAELPSTLGADSTELTVPLSITTASCEAHVIADSKKPFVFPIYLAFGDEAPQYARIPVPVDVQRRLVAYQQTACVR